MAKRNAIVACAMACLLVALSGCGLFNGDQTGPAAKVDPQEIRDELGATQIALDQAENELTEVLTELGDVTKAYNEAESELAAKVEKLTADCAAAVGKAKTLQTQLNQAKASAGAASDKIGPLKRQLDLALAGAKAAEYKTRMANAKLVELRGERDVAIKAALDKARTQAKADAKKQMADLEARVANLRKLCEDLAKEIERLKSK